MRFRHPNKFVPALPLLFALAIVAGYQSAKAETAAVKAELAPAQAPTFTVGSKMTWRERGKDDLTSEVVSVDGNKVTLQSDNGCNSTFTSDGFNLWTRWENCGGNTGSSTFERPGGIFPLEVGKKETYKARGKNDKGNTWSSTWTCRVTETDSVTVPAGSFDTYHVVCKDKWRRKDYYFAPELGRSVIIAQSPIGSSRARAYHQELVKLEPAG